MYRYYIFIILLTIIILLIKTHIYNIVKYLNHYNIISISNTFELTLLKQFYLAIILYFFIPIFSIFVLFFIFN